MKKIRLGLAVAKPDKDLTEFKKLLDDSESTEVILFPEGFIDSDNLEEVCKLVKEYNKWVILGMDDKRDEIRVEAAVVISPSGKIVGEHKKTSITRYEVEHNFGRGDTIQVFDTDFGKIGIAICYEIHVPEVSRILVLQGAEIIFNPIGTGMWHEEQYKVWTSIACARASENGAFVVGCSHYNDPIPIAFVYDPKGKELLKERSVNRIIPINLDPTDYTFGRNFDQRRPELYGELVSKSDE